MGHGQAKIQEDFATFIKESPLAQEFLESQRQKLAAARKEKIDAKALLLPELDKVASTIAGVKEKHLSAIAELERKKEKTYNDTCATLKPLMACESALEREIKENDFFLRSHYDARIDEAVHWFRKKLDELVKTENIHRDVAGNKNNFSNIVDYTIHSNFEAIRAALEYCRESIQKLDTMKIAEADFDYSVIDLLKNNLPDHKVLSKTEGRLKLDHGSLRDTLGL